MHYKFGLLAAALIALGAQTAASAQTAPPANGHAPSGVSRELVYQFGFNTPVAASGNGTGTTTIDIKGPLPDGGFMITGTDSWWNTVRPRARNSCEVYSGGTVKCSQMPYALSPMQLTIFPLLARGAFKGLNARANSSWTNSYTVYAAIIPGANGFAGNPYTWNCSYQLHGKGPIANAAPAVLITTTGTLNQQGGRYLKATSKQRIAYDPVAKVPVVVRDTRTHFPQHTVYNNDLVELKLVKDSGLQH
jgi:hypothetical protein